jgi:anti-sigma factor RsiW
MTTERDHLPTLDEELTAYLDGELAPDRQRALDARLDADPAVRARLEELTSGRPPVEPFDLLLDIAPAARLEAMLDSLATPPAVRPGLGRLAMIAAALLLVIAGAAIGFGIARAVAPTEVAETPGWRAAVADYVSLYTPETFALAPSDPAAHAPRLAVVSDGLGLPLTVETVSLPGLDLKGAVLFQYDGKPLGQISYLSPEHGPVAFCVIANGREDAPPAFEERHGRNIVFWNDGGRGYLIIGSVPRAQLEAFAETLRSRVS